MGLRPGAPIAGTPIDVAFIGSCTNGRISDLREAARVARTGTVAPGVRALVVPGSQAVAREAEQEGLPEIFRAAGFEWREPGCSMCLAMNPDKLVGRELCASSSNRNFKGRQGSPTGPHAADVARDGRGGRAARRGHRRAGDPLMQTRGSSASRAAPACCAATTSTPTASSRRATCAASPSTVSASTPSRTTASRPRAIIRSTPSASHGARILVVGRNFGCGSSREHAPQALMRRGFHAFVGASFAEIFFGNCTALGLPCVTLAPDDLARLMDAVELDPHAAGGGRPASRARVTCRAGSFAAGMPDGARGQLLEGSWNATSVLLEAGDAIEALREGRLPYVRCGVRRRSTRRARTRPRCRAAIWRASGPA